VDIKLDDLLILMERPFNRQFMANYLVENELSLSKFAKKAGLGKATLSRILSGSRRPSPGVVMKILAACEDAKPEDFFAPYCYHEQQEQIDVTGGNVTHRAAESS